jgi:hypothetical protein
VLEREIGDPRAIEKRYGTRQHEDRVGPMAGRRGERLVQLIGTPEWMLTNGIRFSSP